jgi:hypothetical protein
LIDLKHLARLADLIILRLSASGLQVNHFGKARFSKEMMASRNAHFKSEPLEQLTQLSEIPRSIALRIAQSL